MAINFDKFITPKTTTKTSIDFGKFITSPLKTETKVESKRFNFPQSLGGGQFLVGESGGLVKEEEKGFGDIKAPGQYREHIFPHTLGGTSPITGEGDREDDNIKVYGKDLGQQKSNYENAIIRQYKAGELGLNEARGLVLKKYRELTGIDPSQDVSLFEGFKEAIAHPWESLKSAVKALPQTVQTIKDFPETLKATPITTAKTMPDYFEEIKNSWDNAVDKLSDAALAGKEEPTSKKLGKEFEAYTSLAGLALSPITALFTASKNIPIVGSLANIVTLPLAVAGDSATNISGLGLDALVQKGKMKQETADNIRQGVEEIATLAAQILVGGKLFERKGLKDKTKVLEEKFGKKDAETIVRKAKEKASAELEAKGLPKVEVAEVKAKIDFDKFVKKKEVVKEVKFDRKAEVTPEILRRSEQLGDPILQVGENKVAIKLPKLNDVQRAKLFDEIGTIKDFKKQPIHISQSKILKTDVGKKFDVIEIKEAVQRFPEVKKLVEDLQIQRVIPKPIEYVPIKETPIRPTGTATASIAKSIETKAIEKGLADSGFDSLASFERTTLKDQAKIASEVIKTDINNARAIVRGEKPLPEGLNGISLVKAMEEVIKKTKDSSLAYELANSPLAEGVSLAAQELSLTRGRTPDSATALIQRVKKARETKAKKAVKEKSKIKKEIKKETEKVNLSKADLKWDNFLDKIKC